MISDPIADMLSQIRNALVVNKDKVEISYSRVNEQIAKRLEEEGFVGNVTIFKEKDKPGKRLAIDLLYDDGNPKITVLRRISKPGRRIYKKKTELKKILGGYGIGIVSTSRGIMTTKEAKKRDLGGELICEVW